MSKKTVLAEFEHMLKMSELKALSKFSLEQQLTHEQYMRMMQLKKELFE